MDDREDKEADKTHDVEQLPRVVERDGGHERDGKLDEQIAEEEDGTLAYGRDVLDHPPHVRNGLDDEMVGLECRPSQPGRNTGSRRPVLVQVPYADSCVFYIF